VGGYGPIQYRQALEDWIGTHGCPSLTIIVVYTGNDFHDCVWSRDLPVVEGVLGDPGGLRSFLKRNLHLYRLMSRVWQKYAAIGNGQMGFKIRMQRPDEWERSPLREALPKFNEAIAGIAARCRPGGSKVIGVVIPSRDLVELPPGSVSLPVLKAGEAFGAASVRYVDVTEALRNAGAARVYYASDGHLTAAGNTVVADEIRALLHAALAATP
jgi:hypothetical protein